MKTLWYFGYVVASFTFLALLYVDTQIPGFVSLVFPSYIVLLIAIGCGVASLYVAEPKTSPSRVYEVISVAIGVLLAAVVFRAGDIFGAYRLVMALIVLFLPVLMYKTLGDNRE